MKNYRITAFLQAACLLMTGAGTVLPTVQNYALTALAADYIEEESGDYTIHRYETYIEIAQYNGTDTDVTVPDRISDLPVISIGNWAFSVHDVFGESNTERITSVTLPKTLVNIGQYAFHNCCKLRSIVIPDSVTTISGCAFDGCTALADVQLPKKLKAITASLFNDCTSLTAINIPDTVNEFDLRAFNGCSALTAVSIPANAQLGKEIFANCTALKDVTIPEGVTLQEGQGLFMNCKSLETISLPESFTVIADEMFSGCSKLKEITIPETCTSVNEKAFYNCSALTDVVVPAKVTKIEDSAFRDCERLEKLTILNDDCWLIDHSFALTGSAIVSNYTLNSQSYYNGVVCGHAGSAAQQYAEKFELDFEVIGAGTAAAARGDANSDGQIGIEDAQLSLNAYVDSMAGFDSKLTEEQYKAADINGDGTISVEDAQLILLYYVQNTVAGIPTAWDDLLGS